MNKKDIVDGTFEILAGRLYAKTPYGTFPVPDVVKGTPDARELVDAECEFTVYNGIVISYIFKQNVS